MRKAAFWKIIFNLLIISRLPQRLCCIICPGQLKRYRQRITHLDSLAHLLSRLPFRHISHQAQRLLVKLRGYSASYLSVFHRSVFADCKLYYNATLCTTTNIRILHIITQIFHQGRLTAGKARHLFNHPEHFVRIISLDRRLLPPQMRHNVIAASRQSRRAQGYSGHGHSPSGQPPQLQFTLQISDLSLTRRARSTAFALKRTLMRLVTNATNICHSLPNPFKYHALAFAAHHNHKFNNSKDNKKPVNNPIKNKKYNSPPIISTAFAIRRSLI